jgi:hypothetical protein
LLVAHLLDPQRSAHTGPRINASEEPHCGL